MMLNANLNFTALLCLANICRLHTKGAKANCTFFSYLLFLLFLLLVFYYTCMSSIAHFMICIIFHKVFCSDHTTNAQTKFANIRHSLTWYLKMLLETSANAFCETPKFRAVCHCSVLCCAALAIYVRHLLSLTGAIASDALTWLQKHSLCSCCLAWSWNWCSSQM